MTLGQAKAVITAQTKAAKVGVQFSSAGTDKLLQIVKELLPIGMESWKDCKSYWTALMQLNPSFKAHNVIVLKQKFTCLADTKKPTGDPDMQQCMREAKQCANACLPACRSNGQV